MNEKRLIFGWASRFGERHHLIWGYAVWSGVLFVVLGAAWVWLGNIYLRSLIEKDQTVLHSEVERIASRITSDINQRQAILTGMAASVRTHEPDGWEEGHFETFTAALHGGDPLIRGIQFYPAEGMVTVYPIEGNEATLGRTLEDLRTDERANVRLDVQRAIDSGEITLSDPYELRQGGQGVVSRLAVRDEGGELLGLVTVILDLDPLLDVPGLNPPLENTLFALRDKAGLVFYGDPAVFEIDPVTASIILPEGSWELGAAPVMGWQAGVRVQMAVYYLVGLLLNLSVSGLYYLVASRQATLKRVVNERTRALKINEARYATALKVVNEGIWEWDFEHGGGYASENCYSMLGYEPGTVKSFDSFQEVVHPEDLTYVVESIQEGIKSGSGFTFELRMRKNDGSWLDMLARGEVVEKDEDGKALRLLGIVQDITQRKQSESQLRESEAKFKALFKNNHAPMMLLVPETGEITDVNPAACEFYGWSHAEFVTKHVTEINTLTREAVSIEMQKALNEHRNYFHFQHRLASGEVRDVEVYSGPIEHSGQTLLYSIVHDVTSRKQAERALQESENRLRFALEGANDGLWDVQMKTGEVYLSPRDLEILGYSKEDGHEATKFWFDLVHPEDLPETNRRLKDHLEGRSPIFEIEQRLRTKSGGYIWVLTRGKLVERDENGEPQRMTGIHTDITARRQAQERIQNANTELERLLAEADESRKVLLSVIEDQKIAEEKLSQLNAKLEQRVKERTAQLEAANKELEAFSYSVSHDLRAPLRGIDGWGLALQEDYRDLLGERGQQYIDRVRSETQRMGQLIDDLLMLSRVARQEIKYTPVNLSEAARRVITRLGEEDPDRKVEWVIEPAVTARGDANLLEIVLTNLLGNAFKFTSKHPQARVEFGKTLINGTETYFVRDNGAGFDMTYAKNLFGAFQRMHKQSEFPGSGIGLATVQRIIRRHGGEIWADAEKNKGATFYFTLGEAK